MLGLDNPVHIAFLVVILLLVFGAKRLPEIGRSLGSGMREFKDSISGESKQPTLNPATQQPQSQPVAQPPAVQPVTQPVAAQPAPTQAPAAEPEAPAEEQATRQG
ncbi:MAG: twin-arginine translocase TatA/TatE family subunit [Solirubrobacteraceae bacterium]